MLLVGALTARAATTNYFTSFESAEGYTNGIGLVGQQGWSGYMVSTNLTFTSAGNFGNGITNLGLGGSGQAAFVGRTPLPKSYNYFVEVFHPINILPANSGQPVVTFSTRLKIVDSNNGHWDYFDWEVFNIAGAKLFGLEFDNDVHGFYYYDSTNKFTTLGTFSPGVEYLLQVTMNFASNRCTVQLGGVTYTNVLPLTATASALDLGEISAQWLPQIPASPGNNFMLFDNFLVASDVVRPAPPQLRVVQPGGTNAAGLRLTGQDGYRFAVEASTNLVNWLAVSTNTLSGGKADYTDPAAVGRPARYYRARWVP